MTQSNQPTPAHTQESITSHERLIAYVLQVHIGVPMTADAIAEEVGISSTSAKRTVQTLVKAGRVARTGTGDQARYVLLHPLKPIPAPKVV